MKKGELVEKIKFLESRGYSQKMIEGMKVNEINSWFEAEKLAERLEKEEVELEK